MGIIPRGKHVENASRRDRIVFLLSSVYKGFLAAGGDDRRANRRLVAWRNIKAASSQAENVLNPARNRDREMSFKTSWQKSGKIIALFVNTHASVCLNARGEVRKRRECFIAPILAREMAAGEM